MRILTVNAGSSSLKLRLLDGDDTVLASYEETPDNWPDVDAVSHRIVHGGQDFDGPVVVDDEVEAQLRALAELAPLHQPASLAALDSLRAAFPDVPHVACFDTAFHTSIPAAAATYALPHEWVTRYGLRRYGFHGLSHAWASQRATELVPGCRRVVTCHLGAGASLCAVLDGQSIDTTMGFTPVDGLVMATRSGSVDPGLVLWLRDREPDVADALERRSGLLGMADTDDLAEVLRRTDQAAQLALAVYLHRLRASIASMAAALGGLDVCVFTGGVGENAPQIRGAATEGLDFLGLSVDPGLNETAVGDVDVSTVDAAARTLRVSAREDIQLARLARAVLGRETVPDVRTSRSQRGG